MRPILGIVVVLLLGIMLATPSLGTMAFGVTAAPHAVPAGCHSDGTRVPAPTPVNYKCCATGHHDAIPCVWFSVSTPFSFLCWANQAQQALRVNTGTSSRQTLVSFSPGAPGSSFLRI
jgi:hypothetical protein